MHCFHFSLARMADKRAAPSPIPWFGWRFFSSRSSSGTHTCLVPDSVSGEPCGNSLTYGNSTSNCKRHLKRKHSEVYDALQKEITESARSGSGPAAAFKLLQIELLFGSSLMRTRLKLPGLRRNSWLSN